MDLSNPAILISGLLISLAGMGAFMYGKRSQDFGSVGLGLVLMVYPYFVHSVLLLWLIAVACAGGWWLFLRSR